MRTFCTILTAAVLFLFLVLSPSAHAQQFSAVTGVVTDATGSVVAAVQVTLDNSSRGLHVTTQTNELGFYEFLRVLPAGGYQLTFSKDGFKKAVIGNISLGVSVTETRNATLEIGSVSTSVEVEASGEATLNTTDASIGSVIDERRLRDLPVLIRTSPASLLALQPGVVADDGAAAGDGSQFGSVTGARADQLNLTLDGLDVTDQRNGQAFAAVGTPPIDSLQEVRTVVGEPTSDVGRGSSATVSLVTKSGTNQFHGNLREFNRNTLFAANDWFQNRQDIPKGALNRNQFGGSIGGPVHKDKLFFFFDYEGLRETRGIQTTDTVPLDHVRDGELAYINNGAGCSGTSRLGDGTNCVTILPAAQVTALDPCSQPGLPPGACQGVTPGANPALLQVIASRYPHANDLSRGDGVNTGGFIFNAPARRDDNIYTTRLDYNLSQKHKFFLRASYDRINDDDDINHALEAFPGDPLPDDSIIEHDYGIALGYTWTITPNMINQVTVGLTRSVINFRNNFKTPVFPNDFIFGPISGPFIRPDSQTGNVPVPQIRETFSVQKGKHTLEFGGDIRRVEAISQLVFDLNFPVVGLGGNLGGLDPSTRPANILFDPNDPTSTNQWDALFPFLLGRYAQSVSNFAFDKQGNTLSPGSTVKRNFENTNYELYAQDSWRARSDLTITAGLRWVYHGVPYEANGFESIPNINISPYFADRVAAAQQGSNDLPLISFGLGGSANHAPGLYSPDYKDFAPRLGIAYNPSFRNGLLASIFGDRKTTIRTGFGIVYDQTISGLGFELDQADFLFNAPSTTLNFGIPGDPTNSLLFDPRFSGFNNLPPQPTPPTITVPFTPNVDSGGNPVGLQNGGFPNFFSFARNLKTPYAMQMSFGIQRELPGNFLLEVNYFGRLGRRLISVGDSAQLVNFKDPASGQLYLAAFGGLQKQLLSGVSPGKLTVQPWFENQIAAALGASCNDVFHISCTEIVALNLAQFVDIGDATSTIQKLAQFGVLPENVGLPSQTGSAGYLGNFSNSYYHSMLLSLRKKFSNNLQFDFDYTYSHSIDTDSQIANNTINYSFNGAGVMCNLEDPRACRGDSNFDVRHNVSVNFIYDLPVGRGQRFLRDAPGWVNAILGGWSASGIVTWRTGLPFDSHTNSFPITFTYDTPAVLTGSRSAISQGIHTDAQGNLQFFADQTAALNALSFPVGGQLGDRNLFRGPGFSTVNSAVLKNFHMPWSDHHSLQFRWEAFNLFNHPSFNPPTAATLANQGSFGIINSTASAPREMQFALRYQF